MRLPCTIAAHIGGTGAGHVDTAAGSREAQFMRTGQGANYYQWNPQ